MTEIMKWTDLHSGFVTFAIGIIPIIILVSKYSGRGIGRISLVLLSEIPYLRQRLLNRQRKSSPVRIGFLGEAIDYLTPEVAIRRGYLVGEFVNRKIEVTTFKTFEALETAVTSLSVDIIFLASAPALRLFETGRNVWIFDCTCLITQYLLSNNIAYRRVSDLEGATIATPMYTGSHFGAIEMMERNGVPINAVKWKHKPPHECVESFREGDVDILGIWPLTAQEELGRSKARRINGSSVSVYCVACVVAANRAAGVRLSEPAKRALTKAKVWIDENKNRAKSLAQWKYKATRTVVERGWDSCDFTIQLDSTSKREIYEARTLMQRANWPGLAKARDEADLFV